MSNPIPNTKPHFPVSKPNSRIHQKPIKQGKFCSDLLFKSLFLAIFLILVPLFPSQAPEFLSQTILSKFWELLHLLFIGIAVAYGLFSRRNAELETNIETQRSDDNAPSYVSKMFPASTIFGDENETPCEFVESRMMHCWKPQYFDGEPGGVVCSNVRSIGDFDEQYNTQLPVYDDNFGYSIRCDGNGNYGTNVVQTWNSEYYQTEPVVVAQTYSGSGECGEVVGHKPLGLPVRSLKLVAREVDGDGPTYKNESDSSSGSRVSSTSLDKSKDKKFGDLGPSNLENEFNAPTAGGSPSPIPWHSRGRRMRRGKRYGDGDGPSQFRPLSVDETKYEALGSRSLQSTTSLSSHTNMYSSFDSISSDNMNFQAEEMRQREGSYVPVSEKMHFQEKDMGRRETFYVPPAPENMNFQEEETNFQKRDLGKKASQGSSLRKRRAATKGKHDDVSYPSHFRPMSVDEIQFESLSSESFQSTGSFSSHKRMYHSLDSISSNNMEFQEEDIREENTSSMHTSENMNFKEEDMEQNKTSYVAASEVMNFQEEDMEQNKTSYVAASENVNFQEEELGQKKTSFVPASGNMNFQEVGLVKMTQVSIKNEMMETRGKYAAVSHASHFRPISIDETQLESLSSRSFQSMGSFSSQTSLHSLIDSESSENMKSLQEGSGGKNSLRGSSSSSSSPPSTGRNGGTSLLPFQDCRYNFDSLLQDDLKNGMNGELRGKSGFGGGNLPENKESGRHALHSDSDKPASRPKSPSRGKSVRTRRVSGLISGTIKIGETSSRQADEKAVKKPNNVDTVIRKDKMRSPEPDLPFKGIGKKTLDSYCPKPEVTFSNHLKRDKLELSKNVSKENNKGSSDEDGLCECVNDSGLDSEVDKKASEFIAKFKAQIRLQKMGSMDSSKGEKIFGNNIR